MPIDTPYNNTMTVWWNIVMIVVLSFIVGLPQLIREVMVLNYGIGHVPFLRLYCIVLPWVYVLYVNIHRCSFVMPYCLLLLLFMSMFMFFENLPIHSLGVKDYQLVAEQAGIYFVFLLLVNLGYSQAHYKKVITYSFYIVLIYCFIFWLGQFEIIQTHLVIDYTENVELNRRNTLIVNANEVSYICSFGIVLLILKRMHEKTGTVLYAAHDAICMILLFGMTVINASRGAFFLSLLYVMIYSIYFMVRLIRSHPDQRARRLIAGLIVLCSIIIGMCYVPYIVEHASQSLVIRRFFDKPEEIDYRIISSINCWKNFMGHPFLGVGFQHAAVGELSGGIVARSNNQYMQMLATGGIPFFFMYIWYMGRFIIADFKLVRRPEIMLCLLWFMVFLVFKRPLPLTALIGYNAFVFYMQNRMKRQIYDPTPLL